MMFATAELALNPANLLGQPTLARQSSPFLLVVLRAVSEVILLFLALGFTGLVGPGLVVLAVGLAIGYLAAWTWLKAATLAWLAGPGFVDRKRVYAVVASSHAPMILGAPVAILLSAPLFLFELPIAETVASAIAALTWITMGILGLARRARLAEQLGVTSGTSAVMLFLVGKGVEMATLLIWLLTGLLMVGLAGAALFEVLLEAAGNASSPFLPMILEMVGPKNLSAAMDV